jgi:hypothetical protein
MPVYTYTTLDDPLGIGTGASGINDAGQTVGDYSGASNPEHGFLLSGGTYTTIDDSTRKMRVAFEARIRCYETSPPL